VVADEELRPIHVQGSERAASALEDLLFRGNVVGSVCTPLIERTLLEQVGGFDPEMSHCADWDLWVRLARHTEFLFLAEPLVTYRQHGSNLSRRIEPLEKDSLRVLEKAFADPSTPEGLQRRADQAWGRTWMMLAGCYYHVRRFRDFLRCTVKALSWDPAQAARLVLYPWRRLRGTSDWRRQFR
jgi:hypothetical protein